MAHYHRTASTITSGGNLNPANADRGGIDGQAARSDLTPQSLPAGDPSPSATAPTATTARLIDVGLATALCRRFHFVTPPRRGRRPR